MDKLHEFQLTYDFDFIKDYLLKDTIKNYFYLDYSKSIESDNFELIYSNSNFSFTNFKEIFEIINIRSEMIELVGIKEYLKYIKNIIHSKPDYINVTIPIILNGNECNIVFDMNKQIDRSIYIGYYFIEDGKNQEELMSSSYKDILTGLFNRNTLHKHFSSMQIDTNVYGMLIDIDYFKIVNDTYGHTEGDNLLVNISKCMLSMVKEDVIFYRLGGDEFFVQGHFNSTEDVENFVKEFQDKLSAIHVGNKNITCSIGICKYDSMLCKDSNDLLKLCDLGMYTTKLNGRNGYHIVDLQTITK